MADQAPHVPAVAAAARAAVGAAISLALGPVLAARRTAGTIPPSASPTPPDETARARKIRLRAWHRDATCWPDAAAGIGVHRFPAGAGPADPCECGRRIVGPARAQTSRERRRHPGTEVAK